MIQNVFFFLLFVYVKRNSTKPPAQIYIQNHGGRQQAVAARIILITINFLMDEFEFFPRLITRKQTHNPIQIRWPKLIEIQQRQLVCKTNLFVCKTFRVFTKILISHLL